MKPIKTYILKHDVYNYIDFPAGTIITITDDYWGKAKNDLNTGFTVVEGELKGKKGCVADGLKGWLLEHTIENIELLKKIKNDKKRLHTSINNLNKKWEDLPTVVLAVTPNEVQK